jgi:hypothetical protein
MGLIGLGRTAEGIGAAATGLAEVFTPNATKAMEARHAALAAALAEFGVEVAREPRGWFDRLVDGMNRLPRPGLALGTIGLFVYAMAAPESFAVRMQGLAYVPEPLWWLLGAVVSFYFGARELHYRRGGLTMPPADVAPSDPDAANPALAAWRKRADRDDSGNTARP